MKTEAFSLASSTDTQFFNALVRVIRYDEGSGTGTPKIRVRSMKSGAVDIEMIPGRMVRLSEAVDGIVITNMTGAAITGKLTMGAGDVTDNSLVGTVTLDAATLAQLESVDLNAATLLALRQPVLRGTKWTSNAAITAGTPLTVFAPGANANGAILWTANAALWSASVLSQSFIAHTSAPSANSDGETLFTIGGSATAAGNMPKPEYIPPNMGLYFFSLNSTNADAVNAPNWRSARYTLL